MYHLPAGEGCEAERTTPEAAKSSGAIATPVGLKKVGPNLSGQNLEQFFLWAGLLKTHTTFFGGKLRD